MYSIPLDSSSLEKLFPYLKVDHISLTEEHKYNLEMTLLSDSEELLKQFAILVGRTTTSLKKWNVRVPDLISLLKNYHAESMLEQMEDETEISKALIKVCDYWSFFDHDLLSDIIRGYCKDDADLQNDLDLYLADFKYFCQRKLCEVPINIFGSEMFGEECTYLYAKLEHTRDDIGTIKAEDINQLNRQLSKILHTKVRLVRFKEGCIELTYSSLHVTSLLNDLQRKELVKIGVVKLYTDTALLYQDQSTELKPPSIPKAPCEVLKILDREDFDKRHAGCGAVVDDKLYLWGGQLLWVSIVFC